MYDIINKIEKFYERVTRSSYLKTHPTASSRSLFCSLPFQLRVLISSAYLCGSWLSTAKMFYKTIQRREGSLRDPMPAVGYSVMTTFGPLNLYT